VSRGAAVKGDEAVLLVPGLAAGEAGWCVLTRRETSEGSGCGAAVAGSPIVAQKIHTRSPPREAWGIVVTTSAVASVSVGSSAPLATAAERGLPVGLRAVVWRWPGETASSSGFPPQITPLNAHGEAIPQTVQRGPSLRPGSNRLLVELPSTNLRDLANPLSGPCTITAARLAGLTAGGASVVHALAGYRGLIGEAFLACASTEYTLDNWPISASVLVDAANPGRNPPGLPAMKHIPGQAGTFEAPGEEGPQVARRVRGGWLVVSNGDGQHQRLALLDHLRATIQRLASE
jgi:hypothetical protein